MLPARRLPISVWWVHKSLMYTWVYSPVKILPAGKDCRLIFCFGYTLRCLLTSAKQPRSYLSTPKIASKQKANIMITWYNSRYRLSTRIKVNRERAALTKRHAHTTGWHVHPRHHEAHGQSSNIPNRKLKNQ